MQKRFRYYFQRKPRQNPPLSTILRSQGGRRNLPPKHCQICGKATRERKPFCPEHVEHHPYVRRLLDQLNTKEAEEARVLELGEKAVEEESITAKEIISHIEIYGPRTVERLARELVLAPEIIDQYVTRLATKGRLSLSRNNRGKKIVRPNKSKRCLRRRRRNPEDPLLPKKIGHFELDPMAKGTRYYQLSRLNELENTAIELTENTPLGSIIPGCPRFAEIPEGPMVPRATFNLMLSGNFPLIRAPKGQLWKVSPKVVRAMSQILTRQGIQNADTWDLLLARAGSGAIVYIMDRQGERYRVIDVEVDYGGESGVLRVQHLGRRSRGGATQLIDIWDSYGQILPFVVYK